MWAMAEATRVVAMKTLLKFVILNDRCEDLRKIPMKVDAVGVVDRDLLKERF
jgi:hypothetical protein